MYSRYVLDAWPNELSFSRQVHVVYSNCMTRNLFSCAMRDVVVATQKGCFRNEIIVFAVISQVGKLNLFFIMFTYPSD